MPNSLLQILRPFVPTTDDFNRRFVETFAIPEFRAIGSDYSATYSKVVSYLNTYADMEEGLASRILAKSVLIDNLRGLDEDSVEFKEAVEHAIAQDYRELMEEKEAIQLEKFKAEDRVTKLERKVERIGKALEETQDKLRVTQSGAESTERERTDLASELVRLKKKSNESEVEKQKKIEELETRLQKAGFRARLVLAIVVELVAILAVLFGPDLYNWSWLLNHPSRLGIQGACIIMATAASWAIADRNHLRSSLGTLGIGALLVLVQLLGK